MPCRVHRRDDPSTTAAAGTGDPGDEVGGHRVPALRPAPIPSGRAVGVGSGARRVQRPGLRARRRLPSRPRGLPQPAVSLGGGRDPRSLRPSSWSGPALRCRRRPGGVRAGRTWLRGGGIRARFRAGGCDGHPRHDDAARTRLSGRLRRPAAAVPGPRARRGCRRGRARPLHRRGDGLGQLLAPGDASCATRRVAIDGSGDDRTDTGQLSRLR